MLLDAADLEPGARLDADLCIVGAGAAGIAIARELAATPHQVVVLEAGGLDYEAEVQERYQGAATGTLLGEKSGYLTASRLHYFGGSTGHWQGYCRPLDPEDFEARDWVVESGWPLSRAELDPYYARAVALVEVTGFGYDPASINAPRGHRRYRTRLLDGDEDFETTFFHISTPTRFGRRYRDELAGAANVRVLLHGTAVRLAADAEARRLLAVEVAGPRGRFSVAARHTVLASGGIENARLLLASRDVVPDGLGNQRDRVGRYFMDHPAVAVGQVAIPYRRDIMDLYGEHLPPLADHRIRAVLRPSPAWQRERRALNSLFVLEDLPFQQQWPDLGPEVAQLATDVLQLAEGYGDPAAGSQYFGAVDLIGEQVPDPANRVMLGDQLDDLGMQRVRLKWSIGEQDEASLRAVVACLVAGLGTSLQGRLRQRIDGEEIWQRTRWSNHHMGTTRMATSPEKGVVDPDCRVHLMENLWIAGSSVFPTSGCSNPTLTLLALALRLADRLEERLAR